MKRKAIRRDPTKAYVDLDFWVPKAGLNIEGVKNALEFFYLDGPKREQRVLSLWKETKNHIRVPREFWDYSTQFDYEVVDCRPRSYRKFAFKSRVQLDHRVRGGKLEPTGKTVQRESMEALLKARGGVLELGCGTGKTVIFLDYVARRGVPALVAVDNEQLMQQWRNVINEVLEVPGGIGLIQGKTMDWKKGIVLAMYQTLANRALELPEEVRRWFGIIGFDEAHHVNAPTFSRAANAFYGTRVALTATPKRDDGLHVIAHYHIGPTMYRYLKQDLRPKIIFRWTGLKLNMEDPETVAGTCMRNGMLSISKLAVWFGRWQERLDLVISQVKRFTAEGRKILVLSNSVDELVNLLAKWNGAEDLYTAVPYPTPADVGERVDGEKLEPEELIALEQEIAAAKDALKARYIHPQKKKHLEEERIPELELSMKMHEVGCKLEKLWHERQKDYRQKLLAMPSNAGLMIYKVPTEDRLRMLKEKDVCFAISKYGKEGLDDPSLDTVILCEPFSNRGTLQQVMGRVLRDRDGKKVPIVFVLEDEIGPMIGMCKKMRKHLLHWPVEDGGPYQYEFENYPERARKLR